MISKVTTPIQRSAEYHITIQPRTDHARRAKARAAVAIDILLKCNQLTAEEIAEAQDLAKELKESDEIILRRCFGLSDHNWNLALEAAILIESDLLTVDLALSGFQQARDKGTDLRQGLKYFGWGW